MNAVFGDDPSTPSTHFSALAMVLRLVQYVASVFFFVNSTKCALLLTLSFAVSTPPAACSMPRIAVVGTLHA